MTVWSAVLAVVAFLVPMGAQAATAPSAQQTFNVRTYGATGDGTTNDTPAVNAAITAANTAGGGTVEFPAGNYRAGSSIHLLSNVTLQLDKGATVLGAASGYDPAEPNPYDQYQDYGHSHFHDAMIWGDNLSNIGFVGQGTIDGADHLITGTPKPGQADKIISLTRCHDLTVNGITLKRGGHFAMLINGCTDVTSDHLTIDTASDRDGWNVINTQHAKITNITDAANDDALVFKSDYALGRTYPNGDVTVDHAQLSAGCCNALMFGSETCGNFTNYHFSNIVITSAGKSGLGMVSMDGAHISNVHYDHVVMSGTQSPIMEKVGTRLRCGGSPSVGSISDIHYNDVVGTAAGGYSPTLWGQPGHRISDVTFHDVHLTLPGGHAAMDPNQVPTDTGDYNPRSLSTRPAYGFYLHEVSGISFSDSSLTFDANDQRPAFIANTGDDVALHDVTVERGAGSPFDVGFQHIAGYCVTDSTTTTGQPLRLSTPDSTPGCQAGLANFDLAVTPASQQVQAGASATFTVHTTGTAGDPSPIALSATGAPAGSTVTFSPNPVPAGADATMTVSTDPSAVNGSYHLSIVGSDATATQYASAELTVTGGTEPLAISDLQVFDTANAAAWSIRDDLQPGDPMYGDRTFTVATVPASLAGAPWISTANSSKTATVDPLATFTINKPATVSVAVDTRIGRRPWLDESWTDSGLQLTDTEGSSQRTFEIYQKPFPAGQVSLGPEADTANSASMYVVIVS
jgi:hypothetical protein